MAKINLIKLVPDQIPKSNNLHDISPNPDKPELKIEN